MKLRFDAVSDIGCCRSNNEDMILLCRQYLRDEQQQSERELTSLSRLCTIVADGMGGHNGGELASDLACQSFDTFFHELPDGLDFSALKTAIGQWAHDTHASIIRKGKELPGFADMGTTFVGCLIYEMKLYWVNIGDSRLYLFRDGLLRQISTDHSLRELYHDPNQPSNAIYNSLGAGDTVFADFDELPYFEDDLFLVCSDGLSDLLSNEVITSLCKQKLPTQAFIEAAKAAGGKDNVSVVQMIVCRE